MKDSCTPKTEALLSIDQALEQITQIVSPLSGHETIPLSKAIGRILAKAPTSPIDIPPQRVASMDGYAFSSIDIPMDSPFTLQNIGTSWAGRPFKGDIEQGQCIRIFTGAVVPSNADSVIMQELILRETNIITFPSQTPRLQNIRQAGSDIISGNILLPASKLISASDCALLASAGIYEITVNRKINIAFLSTGDELTGIGKHLHEGHIYDCNRYALAGLLKEERFNVTDLGTIRDNKQLLRQALLSSSQTHDVIITTGGASVGDADYIHDIVEECGQVNFWKVAMKPGKPLIFGKIGKCLLFGLPGNPVSVIIIFQKMVLPALQKLSGTTIQKTLRVRAKCLSNLKKAPGRQEYQRGILTQLDNDEFIVDIAGPQDSHQLSALSKANCYIVLAVECSDVEAGEWVTVEPFSCMI